MTDPFGAGLTSIAWTPGNRHLIFGVGKLDPSERKGIELLRVAVDGGEARKLGLTMPTPGLVRVHPDGDRIAWGTRKTESVVWAMENFLPALKGETVSEVRR